MDKGQSLSISYESTRLERTSFPEILGPVPSYLSTQLSVKTTSTTLEKHLQLVGHGTVTLPCLAVPPEDLVLTSLWRCQMTSQIVGGQHRHHR